MARIIHCNLTEGKIKTAHCPAQKNSIDLRDGDGLVLRISESGGKSWRYEYRLGTQKKVLPLGAYPNLSLKEARVLSKNAKELREKGLDPVKEAQIKILGAKQDQLQRAEQLDEELAEPLFKQLVDEYIASLNGAPSQYDVKWALYKDAVPRWPSRKAKSITRRECVLLLDEVKGRAPVLANRLHSYMRTLFKVGVQRGLIEHSPMTYVAKPAPKAEHRDNSHKALSPLELKMLWDKLGTHNFDYILKLMLLTGARPKEVLGMKWCQINGELWTLGAGEHKAGHGKNQVITRPLINPAVELITKYSGIHDELVFPGPRGKAMLTSSFNHFVRGERHSFDIKGFTAHHIRHTISTRMREIGIRPDIVERILGHIIDTGTIGVYNSYDCVPEMRAALEKWSDWITGIVR
jgi:integrase